VRGLGAGVLCFGCFSVSRQCARSRDRCGRRSGGFGSFLFWVLPLLARAGVSSARVVRGLGAGVWRLGCTVFGQFSL
jgi:hypothetical protein